MKYILCSIPQKEKTSISTDSTINDLLKAKHGLNTVLIKKTEPYSVVKSKITNFQNKDTKSNNLIRK